MLTLCMLLSVCTHVSASEDGNSAKQENMKNTNAAFEDPFARVMVGIVGIQDELRLTENKLNEMCDAEDIRLNPILENMKSCKKRLNDVSRLFGTCHTRHLRVSEELEAHKLALENAKETLCTQNGGIREVKVLVARLNFGTIIRPEDFSNKLNKIHIVVHVMQKIYEQ